MQGQMPMVGMIQPGAAQMQAQNMVPNQMAAFQQNQMASMSQKKEHEINQKYKTERCRHYETHKNCILGEKCHFAHGDAELRKPNDPLTQEQMIMA